ncbi:MAG: aminoglycoside phosphotransferase family protein [Elusimicrobia bacterium]|nr:aminoglycoside phosphotransferase family protein [Elusimicrobiota bacterium]
MSTAQLRFDLRTIGQAFQISGEFESARLHGDGHINDTFLAAYRSGPRTSRFILQRINHHVFRDPSAVMDNIVRVLEHLRGKLGSTPDAARRVLSLVPTRTGGYLHRDGEGNYWRAYVAIDGARTLAIVEDPGQARESGRAFGRFQTLLADLPAPRLKDTIPDFHNTPKRFCAFEASVAADAENRGAQAKREIDFALSRKAVSRVLQDAHASGGMPERIVHNDTKFNNVLIDASTNEALCVIDLDTVMPGLALHDFGDMVRTATSPTAEDERDLSKVTVRLPVFQALVEGYVSEAGAFLTTVERRHLAFSGKLIAFELGLRFLTDFLEGDAYFKVHREGHNLDRARSQFRLVAEIEAREDEMIRLAERACARTAKP